MNKYLKLFFISTFFLILFLPFIQKRSAFQPYKSLQENRYKKSKPQGNPLLKLFEKNSQYKTEYEAYYNDNYGLRDLLIRLKNQIDFSFFNRSDEVVINSSGWLFDKEYENRYRVEIDRANHQQFQQLFNKINDLNSYYQAQNIELVFVPIPLADQIYPENFSQLQVKRPSENGYRKFTTFLKNHPEIEVIDIEKLLLEKRYKYSYLYYQTDIHYNPLGAFLTAKEIVKSMAELSATDLSWQHPLIVTPTGELEGILSQYLAKLEPITEPASSIHKTWQDCSSTADSDTDNDWTNFCYSDEELIPQTVIFGNSYMTLFYLHGFPDHFSKLHSRLLSELKTEYASLPSGVEYVIIEFYEIDLWNFLFSSEIPKIEN